MQQFPKVNNLEDLLSLMQPVAARPVPVLLPTFNQFSENKSNGSNDDDFGEFDDFVGASNQPETKKINTLGAQSLTTLQELEKD